MSLHQRFKRCCCPTIWSSFRGAPMTGCSWGTPPAGWAEAEPAAETARPPSAPWWNWTPCWSARSPQVASRTANSLPFLNFICCRSNVRALIPDNKALYVISTTERQIYELVAGTSSEKNTSVPYLRTRLGRSSLKCCWLSVSVSAAGRIYLKGPSRRLTARHRRWTTRPCP